VGAIGDPSPLSALTRLSSLCLDSRGFDTDPISLSSLQPLSTLQQLQNLQLSLECCGTSLQGLAGLGKLERLVLHVEGLRSLEGIASSVSELSIQGPFDLVSLAGIDSCSSMKSLTLTACGVSSLQPLRNVSSLESLQISHARVSSLEGLCGISLQSLELSGCCSLTHLSGIERLGWMLVG
jgi:hypothetical protein